MLLAWAPSSGPITQWSLAGGSASNCWWIRAIQHQQHQAFCRGDIVTYPGKRKLIVCGFHEATLLHLARAIIQIYPERPDTLEYTTSSKHLHAVLGVSTPTLLAQRGTCIAKCART